jgi:hypothetical protein
MADDSLDSILGSNIDYRIEQMKRRNLVNHQAQPPGDAQLQYDLDKRDESSPRVKIEDPTRRLSGSYPKSMLQDIIDSAKQVGIDPLLALSIAGQETAFGSAYPKNWSVHNPIRYLEETLPVEWDSSIKALVILNRG